MKNLIKSLFFILASTIYSFQLIAQSDDATGLPGDNFDLQGALEMFKNANSPEEFEKMINTQDNHVNNLDLNEDGDIDYIKVIDKSEGDEHAFVLQVAISANENQDIAVIELEKNGKESAIVQIVGDEDIYGESLVFEPKGDDENSTSKQRGPHVYYNSDDIVVVNVWYWPSVRFVYGPIYHPWVSPFRWAYYPAWWRPWRPMAYTTFHPFRIRYHTAFVAAPFHRTVRVHKIYTPARVTSVSVTTRNRSAVNNYRVNRKTTTVHATNGNRTVKAKKTTTTVTGKRGNKVKTSNTKVKSNRKHN